MTPPFNWTDETDAVLIQMRAEKKPFAEIAEALNCTPGAAEQRSHVLRKRGVKIWVRMEDQIATPEQLAALRDLKPFQSAASSKRSSSPVKSPES